MPNGEHPVFNMTRSFHVRDDIWVRLSFTIPGLIWPIGNSLNYRRIIGLQPMIWLESGGYYPGLPTGQNSSREFHYNNLSSRNLQLVGKALRVTLHARINHVPKKHDDWGDDSDDEAKCQNSNSTQEMTNLGTARRSLGGRIMAVAFFLLYLSNFVDYT